MCALACSPCPHHTFSPISPASNSWPSVLFTGLEVPFRHPAASVSPWSLTLYPGHWPLIRLLICKCFLSCHRLPIHSVDCVLWCPEVLSFDSLVYCIFFFCCLCIWHHIQEITVKSTLSSALNEWLCHLLHWETMSPAPVPQSSFSLSFLPLPTPSLEEKLETNRWWWPRKSEIADQRGSGQQWPVGSLALDL